MGSKDRIKLGDYKSWDKFDVEKECAKVDKQHPAGEQSQNPVPAKLSESGEEIA